MCGNRQNLFVCGNRQDDNQDTQLVLASLSLLLAKENLPWVEKSPPNGKRIMP